VHASERLPSQPSVYQFKVSLKHISPAICRGFQVTDDITLYRLHLVLQAVMGWENYHLYQFTVGGLRYGEPDPEYGMTQRNARRYRLWQVFGGKRGTRAVYEYDFGDGWEHDLVLEKVLPVDENVSYPVCLEGARACPPEDCGGVPGYQELLDIIADPASEGYAEVIRWLGGSFDPEAFSPQDVDEALDREPRRSRRAGAYLAEFPVMTLS